MQVEFKRRCGQSTLYNHNELGQTPMNDMDPSQRIVFIDEISARLSKESAERIKFIFYQFGVNYSWNSMWTSEEIVRHNLTGIDSEVLISLASHLDFFVRFFHRRVKSGAKQRGKRKGSPTPDNKGEFLLQAIGLLFAPVLILFLFMLLPANPLGIGF